MAKNYYTVLTTYGVQLFAQAMANRKSVNITHFAVGDGNGRAVQPDSTRTALVRQVHRATISAISPDPRNDKQVIFELTLPETIGGFWIREMGIFDNSNRLVAYANCPDTYKPRLEEGSGKVQVMRMILLVSSSNAVTLTVDDSVIFATRGQLTPKKLTATTKNAVDETGHTHEIALASTTEKGLVQLVDNLTTDDKTKALSADQGKKINVFKAIVKGGATAVELDLTNRAQIIAEIGELYKGSGRYYLTLHNSGAQHRLLNFPLGNLRGSIELVVSVMGGYSFLECYYLIANRRFYTHINWNNETLELNWQEVARTATTLAGYGIADFVVKNLTNENLNEVSVSGFYAQPLTASALAERNYPERQAGSLVVTPSAYGVQQEYTTYSSKNKYVRGKQDNNWTAWKRIDGADWGEIRNPVNASTTQRGLAQFTNDTGLDSEMLGLSAKGGKKLAQEIAKVHQLASSKYTAQDASTTQKGLTQLNNSLTSTATNQALTAAQGKALNDKITVFKVPVKSGSMEVQLDLTNRAQIIAEIGNVYRGSGRYYLTFHNSAEHHRLLNFPLGNARGAVELVVSAMGGFSFLECYYLLTNRRFFTRVNWNSETLVLDWQEIARAATTLAGYGITDGVKQQDLRAHFANNVSYENASPKQLPLGTFVGLSAKARLTPNAANGWSLISKGWNDNTGLFSCVRLGIAGNKFYYQTARDEDNWNTPVELATVESVVKKAGDEMTGRLILHTNEAHGAYNLQHQRNAPVFVQAGNAQGGNHYYPYIKGRVTNGDGWTSTFSVGYTTPNGRNKWGEGTIVLNEDNGHYQVWRFLHNGDFVSASDVVANNGYSLKNSHQNHFNYVQVTAKDGGYGGIDIIRQGNQGNWRTRLEALADKRVKFWIEGSYEIFLPTKSGTLLLEGDLGAKTKSLVSRRDYSRTMRGTSHWDNGINKTITVSGSVHIYPDGRIVQIFHLKAMKAIWFNYDGDDSPAIPITLWTAMPHKILDVNSKFLRTNSASYAYEAGEWVAAWSMFRQGTHKDRVQIDCDRINGGADETVDLYVVVEGY